MTTPPYQPFEDFLCSDMILWIGLALFRCCQLLAPSPVGIPYIGYHNNAHTGKTCLRTLMGLASNYFTSELQDEPTLFQLETQPVLCISIQYKPIKFQCDLSEAII